MMVHATTSSIRPGESNVKMSNHLVFGHLRTLLRLPPENVQHHSQASDRLVCCPDLLKPSPKNAHTPRLVVLLGSLALVHAADNLSLLVVNLLVDLGAAGGLVAVHPGGEGGVQLAGLLLGGLLLAAAVGRIVLVVGRGETVGYAALVLCWEGGGFCQLWGKCQGRWDCCSRERKGEGQTGAKGTSGR